MDWLTGFLGWWTAERANVALTAALLVVAALAARIALNQLRSQAADSRARSRPVVTADLVPTPYATTIAFVVKNFGASLARDVKVTFEPALPTSETAPDGQPSMAPFTIRRYAKPIAVLPPGRELSNVYYYSSGSKQNIDGVPERVTVTISYTDDEGHPYSDTYPLDVNVVNMGTQSNSSTSPDGRRDQAVKHLGSVAKSLELIRRDILDAGKIVAGRDPEEERRLDVEEGIRRHRELVARLRPERPESPPEGDSPAT